MKMVENKTFFPSVRGLLMFFLKKHGLLSSFTSFVSGIFFISMSVIPFLALLILRMLDRSQGVLVGSLNATQTLRLFSPLQYNC